MAARALVLSDTDLLVEIFVWLFFNDWDATALCSRQWAAACRSNELWRRRILKCRPQLLNLRGVTDYRKLLWTTCLASELSSRSFLQLPPPLSEFQFILKGQMIDDDICVMPCARIVRVCQLSASSRSSASRGGGRG